MGSDLPGDVQYMSETAHVEDVQLKYLLLLCTPCPRLTAVQECAQNTGSVDLILGALCQFFVGPHSLS